MECSIVKYLKKARICLQSLNVHFEDPLFDYPHVVLAKEDVGGLDQTVGEINGDNLPKFLTGTEDGHCRGVSQRFQECRCELSIVDDDD